MKPDALSGLNVLITRPAAQAAGLQQALEAAGASCLSLPLIAIKPLGDEVAIQRLRDRVLALDNYHCLIFVSNNAVLFGGEVINDYWPQFPLGVQVIAIGPTTAEAARETLSCEVSHAHSGMTSEDILRLPQLQALSGKRIGIVRGQGGRELLADSLRDRGAVVDYLEAYGRDPIEYEGDDFCEKLRAAGVNVLSVSSGESLDRLSELLVGNDGLRQRLDLIVPSGRVAERALTAGFAKVHDARGADPASFIAALGELRANQG